MHLLAHQDESLRRERATDQSYRRTSLANPDELQDRFDVGLTSASLSRGRQLGKALSRQKLRHRDKSLRQRACRVTSTVAPGSCEASRLATLQNQCPARKLVYALVPAPP